MTERLCRVHLSPPNRETRLRGALLVRTKPVLWEPLAFSPGALRF